MKKEIKDRIEQINLYKVPHGYKKTKLGIIPIDWEVKLLGDITKSILDGTHSTPRYTETGVQFYSVENITNNDFRNTKFISEEEHKLMSKRCLVEKGDILMTRITAGILGDTKLIDWDVNASIYVSLALIKPSNEVNSRYLYAYTKSNIFLDEIYSKALINATPKKINLGDISKIKIIIPQSKDEQRKIAIILSTWDKAIELKEKLIQQKKDQKRGLMKKLLTGEVRLPGFEDGWNEVTLGDVIREINEKTTENNQYPVLTSSRKGIFLQEEYFNKSVASSDNTGYKILRKGQFTYRTMSDDGSFKFNQLTDYEIGIVSPAYVVFKATKVNDIFLKNLMDDFSFNKHIQKETQGGTRLSLKYNALKQFIISIPEYKEQEAIASVLSMADKEIYLHEQELSALKLQKKGLMQLLLTGIVRVGNN